MPIALPASPNQSVAPRAIGSIALATVGTAIAPTPLGTAIAPATVGTAIAPTAIGTTLAPAQAIAPAITPTDGSGAAATTGNAPSRFLSDEQIQAQADHLLVKELNAATYLLDAQVMHSAPDAIEYLNPNRDTIYGNGEGLLFGLQGTDTLQPTAQRSFLERLFNQPSASGSAANPSSRAAQLERLRQQSTTNFRYDPRPAVVRPKTVTPTANDLRQVSRNAAGSGARSPIVQEAIDRFNAASKAATERAAANRAALASPPGVRMPTSLRPLSTPPVPGFSPASIARGALPLVGRGLRVLLRAPFLTDLLFPEPTGDLDQSPYAGVRRNLRGNPNYRPAGDSPGGTPAPKRPGDPPTPGTYKPPGSRAQLYTITFSGFRRDQVRQNPAWIGSTPEQGIPPYIFDGWYEQVSGSIEFMGPLTFEYRAPDQAAAANYVEAPSGYDRVHVANPQTGNKILILQASGYFALLTSLQITAPGGLPEPWEIPPKNPPPLPQPPRVPQPLLDPPAGPQPTDPSRRLLPELEPPNQPALVPGVPPIPGRVPRRAPTQKPANLPDRAPNLDPNAPPKPGPKAPPLRPPGRAPSQQPPVKAPGTGKRPGKARPPCLPKGELEDNRVTCRYNPAGDVAMAEILRRLGDPGQISNGLAGALATNENSVQKTLGEPIKNRANKAVSVTNYLKGMRLKLVLTQAMNFLNIFLLLHNAAMLSRNLVESVGDLMSMGLQAAKNVFTGGQSLDDDPIDINELVGQGFQGLMNDIFGKEQWKQIQAKWISFNRIITSAANVAYTIQGLFDGARNIIEITSTNVARIGNALKNSRVVNQNGYGFMNPNINSATGRFAKLQDLLNNSAEVADIGTTIAGETINISEEGKELADNLKRFNENVQEGTNRYNEKGDLIDKDGKLIRPGDAQGTALAESARRVSQGSEISILDLLKGEKNPE